MERELIMERTRAGLQAAPRQGRVGGRKRQMTDSKIQAARKLLESGTRPRDVAQSSGVSSCVRQVLQKGGLGWKRQRRASIASIGIL